MTDIEIVAPISIRGPSVMNIALPKIGIGATIAKIFRTMGQAFEMAYVAPYRAIRPQLPAVIEADLQGRDRTW
jgi:hypothetical protein